MTHPTMEADKMLDVYIYDYLLKWKYFASAKTFQAEAEVSTNCTAVDSPGGFLFEWWSIFWDIFAARYKRQGTNNAESYNEAQITKAQERQQKYQMPQQQRQQQQMQTQEVLQRQIQHQQQRRDETWLQSGITNDPFMTQNPEISNALARKMYEEGLKLAVQKDHSGDADMKPRFGDNVGSLFDSNHASILKSLAVKGQSPGQSRHGTPGGISRNIHPIKRQNQKLPMSTQDVKSLMSPMFNLRAAGSDGSLIEVHGSNQRVNNLPLTGWPLTGLDQLRPELLQQQKTLMQPSQPSDHLPLQQQLMLYIQQNLASSSANDLEFRKLGVLLKNQNMSFGKDDQSNFVGDIVPNDGLQGKVGRLIWPRGDTDVLMQNSQHALQYPKHTLLSKKSQDSDNHLHQQDKMVGIGSPTVDGSFSITSQENDQALNNQTTRKRKQPKSSSGPGNSSGTAKTTGPSPIPSPSTPSTHRTGEVLSMPSFPRNDSSPRPYMFGNDGIGVSTHTSAQNQLANMDRFVDNGSLDGNVESFLSDDDADPENTIARCLDANKDNTVSEIGSIHASKIDCCDLSLDGKLLATAGHDKKAIIWCTDSREQKFVLEEHSDAITDVRFGPRRPWLATSSVDKTIKIWDIDNPDYSLQTFTGHAASVMSLDFHPNKEDLICSSDDGSAIRYWSIKNGSCVGVFKGGATQVRFQPSLGRYLAAVVGNGVSVIDVETTQTCRHPLKDHGLNVLSVCWNSSGEYLASVSEDLVRVWKIGSGGCWNCIDELSITGKKFRCCTFHPLYASVLIIGCYQSLELWNMSESKVVTMLREPIDALAVSEIAGLVASAGHDNFIKLWK